MKFPDFYELAPVVPTHDAFAATLGAAQDGLLEYSYVDAVRLAGHSCPTVAGAFSGRPRGFGGVIPGRSRRTRRYFGAYARAGI